MKKTIQTIILVCLTLVINSIKAQCDYNGHNPSFEEKTRDADVILEGIIISTEGSKMMGTGQIYTSAIIRISKIFKGEVNDTIVELIFKGGRDSTGLQADLGTPIRGVGNEGIFFLQKNNKIHSGVKDILSFTHLCSTNTMITYDANYMYSDNKYQANDGGPYYPRGKGEHYKDLEKELYPKIETLTGQKRKVMGLNGFEKESLLKFKKKIEVKAYQSSSGPCDQENGPCTIIDYAFANINLSANGQILDFDIVSRDEQNALIFSKGDIYINYDANTFGSNIVSNNNIIATQGSLIASPDYLLTLTDQAANTLRLSVGHVLNPTALNTIGLVDQQLAHLTLYISNLGSNGNIAFDNGMMQGNTDYWDNGTATDQSYTVVNVGRMLSTAAISTSSIDYRLSSVSHTAAPGYLTFDIQAQSNDAVMFHRAEVIVDYNDVTFGPNVHSNGNLHCTREVKGDDGSNPGGVGGTGSQHGNDIYYMTVADQSSSAFSMTIDGNGYYDLVNNFNLVPADITSYTTLATCTLKVDECCHGGVLVSIDTNSTGNYASADNSSGNTVQVDTDYIVTASSSYSISSLCQPATLAISSISAPDGSLNITAGTSDVLTITGNGFGCTKGQIIFNNADDKINFPTIHTQLGDILSWSDNEIKTQVPTCQDRYDDGLVAGDGPIQVVLPSSGGATTSGQFISIPYAVATDRDNSTMDPIRVGLTGANGRYVFTPDKSITDKSPSLTTITHAMNDWKCETGVTFSMAAPSTGYISHAPSDGFNSISYESMSTATSAKTYAYVTNPRANSSNEMVEAITEVDIVFNSALLPQGFGNPFDIDDHCPPIADALSGFERHSLLGTARHEFGHAHGLQHLLDPNKLMYRMANDTGICTPMTIDDIHGGIYILTDVGPNHLSGAYSPDIQSFPTSGCNGINGVSDIASGSSVRIYPNPNSGSFTLETYQGKDYTIINMLGQLIAHRDISSDKQAVSYTDLPDGIYTLLVHTTTDTKTLKFTIAK